MAVIAGDGGTTIVIIAEPGAGGLSRPSALGLEGDWTPTLVVVISAAIVNTGAGKKKKKKNSLDGSALTCRTMAIIVGDGGTTSAKHFVLDSSGQSHTDPQSPQLSPFWTGLSRHTFSMGSCPALPRYTQL